MAMANTQNVNRVLDFLSMMDNLRESPTLMTPSFKFRMEILMARILEHWSKTSPTLRAAKLNGTDTGRAVVEATLHCGVDVTVVVDFFERFASGEGSDFEVVFKTRKIQEWFALKAKDAAIAASRDALRLYN